MNIPIKSYWALLNKYLRPQLGRVALLAFLLISTIGLRVANPQIVRRFLDSAQSGGDLGPLLWAGGLFLAFAIIVQALTVLTTYVGEQVGWTATNALRADLALHCYRLDMRFHNAKTPGEMIERIDGDVMDLSMFFSQLVVQVLGNSLLLVGVLIALAVEDWRIGLGALIFSGVALYTLNKYREVASPYWKQAREAHSALYGFIEEQLSGTEDIRSSGAIGFSLNGLYRFGRQVYLTEKKAGIMGMVVWMIFRSWMIFGRILIFVAGFYLYNQGLITLGTAYLLVNYLDVIFGPLANLTQEIEHFQKAAGSIGRIRDLLALKSEMQDAGQQTLAAGALDVRFDDVSFGYSADKPILKHVTFGLEPGQVLGVLGRTGSGKTTVARLLFRLYDVVGGCIRLQGVALQDIPLAALPAHIGMVTQDVQLFRATVRENLTLFDAAISDDRIRDVINDLELSEWFGGLAKGLDTELESGGKQLSAGEGQLLAFARVFLRDPDLVILDEASSRLDPATEQRIERAIDKLLGAAPGHRRRTAIIIAHRLATVRRVDDILILDEGEVVEYAPRHSLLADPESRFSRLMRVAETQTHTEFAL